MQYSSKTKNKASFLRKQGLSLNEIKDRTGISKATLSGWLKNIQLSIAGKERLRVKIETHKIKISRERIKRTKIVLEAYLDESGKGLKLIKYDKAISQLLCALMYSCDGSKNIHSGVRFTNSDPDLIRTFLRLFRNSYEIDENKFRICLHLHDYHDKDSQIEFWSEISSIPKNKFLKTFFTKQTEKLDRDNKGSASIRYHDTKLAQKLLMTAKAFSQLTT